VVSLYQCQLKAHELLTAYYFFASDPGNPQFRSDMQAAQTAVSGCETGAESALRAMGLGSDADTLHGKTSAFDTVFRQNQATVLKKGAPEYEVLNTMVKAELELVATMEQVLHSAEIGGKVRFKPQAEQARRMAVLIQYATARYVERATAAAAITVRDDSAEPAIDELAHEFDKGLLALQAGSGNTAGMSAQLTQIVTKWHFIQGSLLNYNQKTVPFTVNRQGRALAELLGEVATRLEGGS
jgi:hypothetical protein